jgi:hypothetical protein
MDEIDYTPHMPDVGETLPEETLDYARQIASDSAKRHLVMITPGRAVTTSSHLPPPGSMNHDFAAWLKKLVPLRPPANVVAIGMTDQKAFRANPDQAIPFMNILEGLVQLGHAVILFEGHPSAFTEVVRGVDALIVDAEMAPFLQKDWLQTAIKVMKGRVILEMLRQGTKVTGIRRFHLDEV